MEREKRIVRASIVGIVSNLLLTAFKLLVGFAANSIAIILDAINNATDALSSIVTIVGTKLAGRQPDRKHPFGYGRVEYMTSVAIALIILFAGVLSLEQSAGKIIRPEHNDYTWMTLTVIVVAIFAKIAIGFYLKKAGDSANSRALTESGLDSYYDAALTGGTLVVALAAIFFDINIDGIVGLIISLVVCKAGLGLLVEAMGPIIGERQDDGLGHRIREFIASYDGVLGCYDLLLDNFGPYKTIGSAHIEVEDDMTAAAIHELTRTISNDVYRSFNIIMTIGVYAANTGGAYAAMRARLQTIVDTFPEILEVHGFYVDESEREVDFDLVLDFGSETERIRQAVVDAMKLEYPDYSCNVVIDYDYID